MYLSACVMARSACESSGQSSCGGRSRSGVGLGEVFAWCRGVVTVLVGVLVRVLVGEAVGVSVLVAVRLGVKVIVGTGVLVVCTGWGVGVDWCSGVVVLVLVGVLWGPGYWYLSAYRSGYR